MKHFNSFLNEALNTPEQPKRLSDDLVTVFGRHNPPHLGHGKTLDKASKIAGSIGDKHKANEQYYTSQSQDPKKNPLPFQMKLHYLKKMFPQHADKWSNDMGVRTVLQAAQKGHNEGYKNFHFVGGGDRREQMEGLLRKYNGELYDFENIYSHSAGEREENPDDPIANLSASKMRNAAMNGNMDIFKQGLQTNKNFTEKDVSEMFNNLRMFMQKNEEWEIDSKTHREFVGEKYRTGVLFQKGDVVESLSTGLVGTIHRCGANHLICVTEDGIMFKSFLHDVQTL